MTGGLTGGRLAAGPVPLYHRLYLVLRQQIEEGRFPADAPLPGEIEISRRHGVSRITVRRTMDMLTAEGFVERLRGRGTFVRAGVRSGLAGRATRHLSGLADNLSSYAAYTTVALHALEELPAPPAIARALGIEPGTPVQRAVRTRGREGVPVSYLVTHVPADLGRTFTRAELEAGSLIRLLERGGRPVDSAQTTITSKLAEGDAAALLKVEVGQPLIATTRLVFDTEGRAIEHLAALYRPDQYEIRLDLARDGSGSSNLWRYEPDREEGSAPRDEGGGR